MVIVAGYLLWALVLIQGYNSAVALPVLEKDLGTEDSDYNDYRLGVRYDEYPLIVPKKRSAFLMNHLMVALKEAIEDEERKNLNDVDDSLSRSSKDFPLSSEDVRTMELERRGRGNLGQKKGRNYWRCYFNAVTCF